MTRVIDDEFNPTPEQAEYLSERANRIVTGLALSRVADQKRDEERAELVRLRARVAELEAKVAAPPWETLNVLDGEIDRLQAEVERCHALYPSLQNK